MNGVRRYLLGTCLAALLAAGCRRKPACGPEDLAAIEAAYIAAVVAACRKEGSTFDQCAARAPIEERYATKREEWVRCH